MDKRSLARTIYQLKAPSGVSFYSLASALRIRGEMVALGGILIASAVLRLVFLGSKSVWSDEAFVALVAQMKWPDIFTYLRLADTHPPLYYLVMKTWITLAGGSEVALRIPSVFFSLISVVLTYALMRQVSAERVSLVSALLVGTAPLEIWSGQMARMYALLGALTLGATLALVRSVQRQRWQLWAAYAVAATLMVYTHDLAFLVLAAHGLWVVRYERRHLGRWLAVIGAVMVFYAPWSSSLWYQITHAPSWFLGPPYSDRPAYAKISDLFGLFAFGGYLFGMPSYFFSDTPLTSLEQLLLLLPFLIVLGFGIVLLSDDRRRLALLWLPLAVTVGVMQLVALEIRAFSPRWFSFLCPFYAMLIAEGAFALSRTIRDHSDWIATVIIAAVLFYNLAGLDRYYFDPAIYPFQWRAAAAALAREVQPSDLLLFGDQGNEVAFAHYFKGRAWTMKLLPTQDFETIRGLGSRYHRVWFIVGPPANDPALIDQTVSALRASFALVDRITPRAYPWVYRFEGLPPSSP